MVVGKISKTIFCHSPVNPPAPGRGVDIEMNLANASKVKFLNWQNGSVASFTLEISDPGTIGLANSQNNTVEQFIDDFILACNLLLKKAAFSRQNYDSAYATIERKPRAPSPPAKVEDFGKMKKVTFTEVVEVTDSWSITTGFKDELDEPKIIELMTKIRKIHSGSTQTSLKTTDLQKALCEYDVGMTSFEGLGIFKHLFSSLELSTNCDGIDRNGSNLDAEANRITGVDIVKIEDCRRFNARTKHIDKNQNDEKEYQEGLAKIGEKIIYLRQATCNCILDRLKNI